MKRYYLAIGLVLLLAAFCFGQTKERIISFPEKQQPGNMSPDADKRMIPTDLKGLELLEISVEGKPVTAGKSFMAGDDWLKTFKIKLKNISGKVISSIRMSFALPESSYNGAALGFSLAFGSLSSYPKDKADRSIKPDEEFEMTKSEEQYNADKNFWISRTGVDNINLVTIGLVMIKFEDGTMLWANLKPQTS